MNELNSQDPVSPPGLLSTEQGVCDRLQQLEGGRVNSPASERLQWYGKTHCNNSLIRRQLDEVALMADGTGYAHTNNDLDTEQERK